MTIQNAKSLAKENLPELDLDYFFEIAEDDDVFFVELLEIFISQSNKCINEISEDLEKMNMSHIQFNAHKLKPTFLFIGHTTLNKAAEFIENELRNNKTDSELCKFIASFATNTKIIIEDLNKYLLQIK